MDGALQLHSYDPSTLAVFLTSFLPRRIQQKIKTAPGPPHHSDIFTANSLSFLSVEILRRILTVEIKTGTHTGFKASLGEGGI